MSFYINAIQKSMKIKKCLIEQNIKRKEIFFHSEKKNTHTQIKNFVNHLTFLTFFRKLKMI